MTSLKGICQDSQLLVDGLLDGLVVGCIGLVGCLVAWCRLGGLLSCLRLLEKHAGHDHEALGCSGKTKKTTS